MTDRAAFEPKITADMMEAGLDQWSGDPQQAAASVRAIYRAMWLKQPVADMDAAAEIAAEHIETTECGRGLARIIAAGLVKDLLPQASRAHPESASADQSRQKTG